MKIAIIGLNPDLLTDVPWDDDSWKKWILAWAPMKMAAKADLLLDPHDPSEWKKYAPNDYFERIVDLGKDYVLHGLFDDERQYYPGRDYFECSATMVLARAIWKDPKEIGIFGFNPENDHEYQIPNFNYWIGFAEGRGIKVTIPDNSCLCKYDAEKYCKVSGINYPKRYGWVLEPEEFEQEYGRYDTEI